MLSKHAKWRLSVALTAAVGASFLAGCCGGGGDGGCTVCAEPDAASPPPCSDPGAGDAASDAPDATLDAAPD